MPNWRFDSLSPQAAKFFDTELEHVRKEVVADSVPECSAQLIFPQDTYSNGDSCARAQEIASCCPWRM